MYPIPSITRMESQCLVKNFALAEHTDNIERCHCPHLLSISRLPVLAAVNNPRARENFAADPACRAKLIFHVSHRYNCSIISCNSYDLNIPSLANPNNRVKECDHRVWVKRHAMFGLWNILMLKAQCLVHCLALVETVIKHKIPSDYAIWVTASGLSVACSTETWILECVTELHHQIDTPHKWLDFSSCYMHDEACVQIVDSQGPYYERRFEEQLKEWQRRLWLI